MMNDHSLLEKIAFFQGLSPQDLSELTLLLRRLSVEKGEVVFRKDSEGNALYIIKEGAIKIVLPSQLGEGRILTVLSSGDFFGEMALLDGQPRSADAVAMEPSTLLMLNRKDFMQFLTSNSAAMEAILTMLSIRLRKTNEMLEDTTFLSISARLAKKLLEIGENFGRTEGNTMIIDLRVSQKDLAYMVGATRESINKELRILKEKKLITVTRKHFRINDLDRFKRRIHY